MILQLFDPESSTYTYIVADGASREAAIIDPVLGQSARDLAELQRHKLNLRWILDTHVHADHETGANALKAVTGAVSAVGAACQSVGHDRMLVDGDLLALGERVLRVLATPGHTPGSVSYLWESNVFTGDTLLIEGCGRTDFQGGSSDELYESVTAKLFTLPDETLVWPAHDYRLRGSSTIGYERAHNPRFAGKDAEAFCALMAGLNLPPPKLIDQAVPANRAGGALHAGQATLPTIRASALRDAFDPRSDRLIDLRDASGVAAAPLADAVAVGMDDHDTMRRLADQAETLYIICQIGRRSLAATEALVNEGVTNVCNVTGGVSALSSALSSAVPATQRSEVPHG